MSLQEAYVTRLMACFEAQNQRHLRCLSRSEKFEPTYHKFMQNLDISQLANSGERDLVLRGPELGTHRQGQTPGRMAPF
jgi:hypothetical protein